jgi:two-component system cell cycle sensor histidine kinase/response regulator CckA
MARDQSNSPKFNLPDRGELDNWFELSGALLCILNPDGKIHRFNPAWQNKLGLPETQLKESAFPDLVHADDRSDVESALREVASGNPHRRLRWRFRAADGGLHDLEWEMLRGTATSAIYAASRTPGGDKSTSLQRYARLFETARDGMLILDLESGRIEDTNPRFLELTGYHAHEVVGRHILELPLLRSHASGKSLLERLQGTGHLRQEDAIATREGHALPIELVCTGYTEGSRRLVHCNIRDTSERAAAEAALRESEERFRLLVDGVRDYAIFMVDKSGMVISWNAGSERLLGYSETDALGKYFQFIFTLEDQQIGVPGAEISRATQSGVSSDDRWHLRKDGSRFYVSGVLTALRGPNGELRGFAKLMQDVTERRRTEEALRQAGKLESIGILAGGVAHDFNNLLVGIMGGISFARTTIAGDHPAYPMLELAEQSSQRAADLTKQLLAYAGKAHVVMAPIDLARELTGLLNMLRMSISPRIDLHLDSRGTAAMINGDPVQVQQIVMNLVTNAAEAIGEKAGIIRVTTETTRLTAAAIAESPALASLRPGQFIQLEVTDNGAGMDPQMVAKIFDPFFSTKFMGRGLGLAAVSGIVRTHKGAITVISSAGEGSTFRVYFPVMAARPTEKVRAPRSRKDLCGSGTILIVDDEPGVLITARRTLETFGYTVLEATNGMRALAVMREEGHQIDAVLLDLSMPDMSGDEVLSLLREMQPHLPVVISSGYNDALAGERFGVSIDADFLQKPYDATQLGEIIQSVLKRRKD